MAGTPQKNLHLRCPAKTQELAGRLSHCEIERDPGKSEGDQEARKLAKEEELPDAFTDNASCL